MTEKGLWANTLFALPMGLICFIAYCALRTRMTRFYHRNILLAGRAIVNIPTGFFAWTAWIIKIPDREYLAVAGLDAYSAVSAMQLVLMLVCCFASLGLFLLLPYYYYFADKADLKFTSFSITSVYEETLWLPIFIQLFMTAVILYALYHFCHNFVPLRQAYLLKPSAFTALGRLMNASDSLGSVRNGRRRFDAGCRSVLLHPIPGEIGVHLLQRQMQESGLSGISRVQKIGNVGAVMGALGARNRTLGKLEGCLKGIYQKLKHKLKKLQVKGEKKESMERKESKDETSTTISITETTELLKKLLNDKSYLADLRPRHKTTKPASNSEISAEDGTVDSLQHFHAKLMEREAAVQAAIQAYDKVAEEEVETGAEPVVEASSVSREVDEKQFLEETSFISFSKLISFSSTPSTTTNALPRWTALIHFESDEDANRAKQLLLSARLHEMILRPAPAPATILTGNLRATETERFHGAVISNTLYILLLILFSPVMAALIHLFDMKEISDWFPAVKEFTERWPITLAIIEGIVAPYIVLRLTKLTPKLIAKILLYRKPDSAAEVEMMLQRAGLFFFFFQMLLIAAFFSSTYQLYTRFIAGQGFIGMLAYLQEIVPQKAHLFFKFFFLSVAVELMFELVNPYSMVLQRDTLTAWRRKGKLARQLLSADSTPLEGSIGMAFSRYIIYPFFVVCVYAIISPLVLIPAVIYFACTYVVFKQRILYTSRGANETGGEFWRQAAPHIINGLLLGQASLILQLGLYRRGYLGLGLMLVVFFTTWIAGKSFFERTFGGKVWSTATMIPEEKSELGRLVEAYERLQLDRKGYIVEAMHCGPIVSSELGLESGLEVEKEAQVEFNVEVKDDIPTEAKDTKDTSTQINNNIKEVLYLDRQFIQPYWYMCPLEPLLGASDYGGTFDPLHVDHLVDVRLAEKPYSHPGMMAHSQVLILPRKLPKLLSEYEERNAEKATA